MGGSPSSDVFKSFEDLTLKGFMVARSVMDAILSITSVMVDSGLPCFLHKEDNVISMQERFFPNCSDTEAAKLMRGLVADAANKWTTIAYDGIQKLQNNIYSDSWK
jgi:phosphatidylinositol 4-kinase A